ncbi:MAG TPA: hypothetical protein VGJ29_09715 [Vicinamibacterales bacterium]
MSFGGLMNEWGPVSWVFLIPVVAIIGGITVAIVATITKGRIRELEIRERIAMIEKGLVPPPEVDPRGFERVMDRYDRVRQATDAPWRNSVSSGRHRRAGVTLMGVGFGLMVLISIAGGAPDAGVGVGGFLVVIGLAFFVNSFFDARLNPQPPSHGGPIAPSSAVSPRGPESMPPS